MKKNNWSIIIFLLFFIFIILPIILNLVGIKITEGLENKSNYKIMGQTDFPKDKINLPPDWPVDMPIYIFKEWPKNINFNLDRNGIIPFGTVIYNTSNSNNNKLIIMSYNDENKITRIVENGIIIDVTNDMNDIEEYYKEKTKYHEKITSQYQQNHNGEPIFNFNNGMPPNTMLPMNNTMPPMNNAMPPMNNAMPPMNNAMPPMNNAMPDNTMPPMNNTMPPYNNEINMSVPFEINNKLDFIIQKIK